MGVIQGLLYNLHILEAMAFNRKDGIDKVNDLLNPIIHHLVKIAIYTHSKDRDIQVEGWENEILNWLEQIDEFCNNLKNGKQLKLADYMLCLKDDLGQTHLVRSKINRWSRAYKGKCNRDTDAEALRLTLWDILETQFKDMSNKCWDEFSLTNHNLYYVEIKGGQK